MGDSSDRCDALQLPNGRGFMLLGAVFRVLARKLTKVSVETQTVET